MTNLVTSLLQNYGGWGLSAITMIALWRVVKYALKLIDEREKSLKDFNDNMFKMMEKRIEVDIKHEEAFKQLKEVVKELIGRL